MKNVIFSKTLWINLIGGIIVLLQYLGTINVINPGLLATILVIVNFILRLITNQGVTFGKSTQ